MTNCAIVYVDLQAAAALAPASGAGTAVRTVLVGDDALGPIAWVAPEVLAGSLATGVTATPASDVYMLGGLMFEVLTCGLTPYYWLSDLRLVAQVCTWRFTATVVLSPVSRCGVVSLCPSHYLSLQCVLAQHPARHRTDPCHSV